MATVKILIEGYAKKIKNGWVANSTCCLITTFSNKKIITDPGSNRKILLKALKKEGLTVHNINYVFLSHRHPDHVLLAGLFDKAKYVTFDSNLLYDNDLMVEFNKDFLGDDVEIISTPGHVNEHLSLIVTTSQGKIAVAGDTIWWWDDEEQIFDIMQKDHNDAIDLDMKLLIESRKKLIEKADYIIPGHGKIFKVRK